MQYRHKSDGTFCCMCDFCFVSDCALRPFYVIGFTDNFYLIHCSAHKHVAECATLEHLLTHIGVFIEAE